MTVLTVEQLGAFLERRERSHPVDALIDLAESTLVEFLGADWVDRNVRTAASRDFFRVARSGDMDDFRHHHRYIQLAEMLFNLQEVPGFEKRIEAIVKNNVETGVAELEVGKFLKSCGLNFAFREEVGRKGEDYDVSVDLEPGHLPVEAKCKVEGTEYSEATLRNTLADARGQLPSDESGVIFLKLLEEWFLGDDTVEALDTAVRRFLGSTGRVVGVVLMWERWTRTETGARVSAKYDVRTNPKARSVPRELEGLLSPRQPCDSWTEFLRLVGSSSIPPLQDQGPSA